MAGDADAPPAVASPDLLDVLNVELAQLGYRLIRTLRTAGCRRWVLARGEEDGTLWELECFDRLLVADSDIDAYAAGCLVAADTPAPRWLRQAKRRHDRSRTTLLARPHADGEPVSAMLLRPGRPTAEQAAALATVCAEIITDEPEIRAAALAHNLYLTTAGDCFLDALTAGPRAGGHELEQALVPLLQDTAGPVDARAFCRLLYARLLTGSPTPTRPELDARLADGELTATEHRELRGLLAHPRRLPGSRRRRPVHAGAIAFAGAAAAVVVAVMLLLATPEGRGWLGDQQEQAAGERDLTARPVVARAAAPDNQAARLTALDRTVRQSLRLAAAGQFDTAAAALQNWGARPGLSEEEQLRLASAEAQLDVITEDAFTEQMAVARALGELARFEEALAKMALILDVFPPATYGRPARLQADAIRAARVQQLTEAVAQRQAQRRQRQAERDAIGRVAVRRQPYNDPGFAAAAAAADRVVRSQAGKGVLATMAELQRCEAALFDDLLLECRGAPGRKRLVTALPERFQGRIEKVDATGMMVIQPSTVQELRWSDFTPAEMLAILHAMLGAERSDRHHYLLYQFARKYGLTAAADSERANVRSGELTQRVRRHLAFEKIHEQLMLPDAPAK
jgi:hypothetical protein